MNKILNNFLSSALVLTLLSTAPINTAYAASAVSISANAATTVELKSENISFEYVSTTYNGQARKPAVTVTSNGTTLIENTDFIVSYPEDCTNAGVKTVSIKGIGGYSGTFSATYEIRPLDISVSNITFSAVADPCRYNGFEQIPEFTLKANGITIPKSSYTTAFSNNINASNNASCEFTFNGNFSGKRTVEFQILKAECGDVDIELNVRPNEQIIYDLSAFLPEGASFGTPGYFSLDFPENGKPVVAFNELRLTCGQLTSDTAVSVPVIGANNYTDFYVNVYLKRYDKIVPNLVIKPIIREYNGKDIQPKDLVAAGCYAEVNGSKLEGEWEFWKTISGEPHTALPYSFTFEPEDASYESVGGVVFITINKIAAKDFSVRLSSNNIDLGKTSILTVSGVPEDRVDELKIECEDNPEDFWFIEHHSPYQDESELRFKLNFPYLDGNYTVTASLPEDGIHAAAKASCTITVGDYVPPEEQLPDNITTEEELSEMIAVAPMNGFVSTMGMRSISKELVTAAAAKNLTLEVKLNDTYTWVLKTEKLKSALNLNLSSAVIPSVLTEKIGGSAACAFTVFEKNLGSYTELRVTVKNSDARFANLFYYNTDGGLDFVTCARIEADHTAELKLEKSGKYVVITDNETKLLGDIDNDRVFNLTDIVHFLNLFVNQKIPSGNIYKYDINRDDKVNLDDVSRLLNLYVNRK